MLANKTLLQRKYARVINLYAARYGVTIREAMDLFYKSLTYAEMREGISDMHCRSDEYLAEELFIETKDKKLDAF